MLRNNNEENQQESKKNLIGRDRSFYEQYNLLTKSASEQKDEFDKKFFYVVSSLFAFSILFVQFAKDITSGYILLIVWCSNFLALLFHLTAHLAAEKTLNELRKKFADVDKDNNEKRERVLRLIMGFEKPLWGKVAYWVEIASYILFVSAVFFFLWFVYINLV